MNWNMVSSMHFNTVQNIWILQFIDMRNWSKFQHKIRINVKNLYHHFKIKKLPWSAKKKTTSCWFLLCVESSTVYNRQARRQRGNVLPCQQSTSSTSTGTELIHASVHYLEWKTWWLCTFQLECVHNSSRKLSARDLQYYNTRID